MCALRLKMIQQLPSNNDLGVVVSSEVSTTRMFFSTVCPYGVRKSDRKLMTEFPDSIFSGVLYGETTKSIVALALPMKRLSSKNFGGPTFFLSL